MVEWREIEANGERGRKRERSEKRTVWLVEGRSQERVAEGERWVWLWAVG